MFSFKESPLTLSANSTHSLHGVDYPEAVVLFLSTLLVLWQYQAGPLSLAMFVIVAIPSLAILLYNYTRSANLWTSTMVVVLLGVVIGSLQFCLPVMIGLGALIGFRVIMTKAKERKALLLAAVLPALSMYFVSHKLKPEGVICHNSLMGNGILLLSVIALLWQFWQVYRQWIVDKEVASQSGARIQTMVAVISKLTRFIPPQVWQPIVKSNKDVQIVNKRAKLTVLFSDIAGFTHLSDSLSADNLADILNTYMDRMTLIANRHGATLDKFIGDGMVCFFGEPTSKGSRQDAIDCVAMAIDMRREMRTLRHQWRLLGFDGLYIRIGIATGYCHVGNFGSENRMSYTLIGREVNLASRLESTAKSDEILISEATYDYICHEYGCVKVGPYQLKGFEQPVNAWQVLDPDANDSKISQWIDHELPGFNLHLNFKDIKNYDYDEIEKLLSQALLRINDQKSILISNEDEN